MNISKIAEKAGVKRQIIYRILYGKKMRLTDSFLTKLASIINSECNSTITIIDLKKGIFLSPSLLHIFQSSPARKSIVLSERVSHLRCRERSLLPTNAASLGKAEGELASASDQSCGIIL